MNIKQEADRLLYEYDLYKIIENYGIVYIVGSYKMDMMVWNDLDITVENNNHSFDKHYCLTNEINAKVKPYHFEGMYSKIDNSYFYGCETNILGERWNIDIWFRDKIKIMEEKNYSDHIIKQVSDNPEYKNIIKQIKEELIKINIYGIDKSIKKHYHSNEIYNAVLNDNIQNFNEFMEKHPK